MQNFGVTNKEHYDALWYFLEWSIAFLLLQKLPIFVIQKLFYHVI